MRAALLALVPVLAFLGPAPLGAAPQARSLELRADDVVVRDGGAVVEARGDVRIVSGGNRITAARAVYFVRERRLVLSGGIAVAGADGDLEATSATVLLGRKYQVDAVQAAGKVVLETQQRVVRAEHLTYSAATGTVTAAGGVDVFVPPDIIATGQRLVSKRAEAVILEGRARVQTKDGYIEGDRIDFAEREQIAYVRGTVVGVFEETRITAAAATFYGRERRAVFRDGVQVIRPGRTIQAEVVTVFYQDRRIVAEGQTTIRVDDGERP